MYFEKVIEFLLPFFTENGFEKKDEGIFANENAEVKVEYDEVKKVYNLYLTKDGETKNLSSFLFDESQTESDAEAVAIDFTDSLKSALGIKKNLRRQSSEIELPTKGDGEKVTVLTYASKLLAIFPEYKDTYKAHVAKYGKYLPIEFNKQYFIPEITGFVENGNKKQLKKFFDAVCELFVSADAETTSLIVSLLSAVSYNNEESQNKVREYTSDCPSLYVNVLNFSTEIKHNKKLYASLFK